MYKLYLQHTPTSATPKEIDTELPCILIVGPETGEGVELVECTFEGNFCLRYETQSYVINKVPQNYFIHMLGSIDKIWERVEFILKQLHEGATNV